MSAPKYQTVSIWWFPDHYILRGYYRGASYGIGKFDTLQEAVDTAFATDRKDRAIGLIPAKEEIAAYADKVMALMDKGAKE